MKRFNVFARNTLLTALIMSVITVSSCSFGREKVIETRRGSNATDETSETSSETTSEVTETTEETTVETTTETTSETTKETTEVTTEQTEETETSETSAVSADMPLDLYLSYGFDYNDDYSRTYSYEKLMLSPDCAAAYPKLDERLQDINSDYGHDDAERLLEKYVKDTDAEVGRFQRQIYIKRLDDKVLSFVCEDVIFDNANRDEANFYLIRNTSYNLDVNTGKILTFDDIATDTDRFSKVLSDTFKTDIEDPEKMLEDNKLGFVLEPQDVFVFENDDDGLLKTSHFIGNDCLNEDYGTDSQDFMIDISNHVLCELDRFFGTLPFDGGKNLRMVMVYADKDEYGNLCALNIELEDGSETPCDSVKVDDGFWALEMSADLVCVNGKYFLYVKGTMENDYSVTYAFSIGKDKVEYLGNFDGYITGKPVMVNNPYGYQDDDVQFTICCIPTRIDELNYGVRCNLLGTYDLINDIDISGGLATIAVVGRNLSATVAVGVKSFEALSGEHVNVRFVDHAPERISVQVGVSENDYKKSIRAIYKAFTNLPA